MPSCSYFYFIAGSRTGGRVRGADRHRLFEFSLGRLLRPHVIRLSRSAATLRVSLLCRQKANNKRRRKGEVSPLRILLAVVASVS